MGFLRQLSERFLRVLSRHDNKAVFMETPAFQGRSLRGGLFWVLFWAVAKEPRNIFMAPAVRIPQCLTKRAKQIPYKKN